MKSKRSCLVVLCKVLLREENIMEKPEIKSGYQVQKGMPPEEIHEIFMETLGK